MQQFKAALFDLDGTLVDTEGQYSVFWSDMGRRFHPEIPNFDQIIKGTTLTSIFERYFPLQSQQDELTPLLNQWEADMEYPFVKGVETFMESLKANGVKCAVVTSSNQPKLNSVRRKVENFDRLFDIVLTAEDFSASKPDPDCYLKAADRLGVKKEECVVFEDALNGLQAGMAAGMFTVGLTTTNSEETIKNLCHLTAQDFTSLDFKMLDSELAQRI